MENDEDKITQFNKVNKEIKLIKSKKYELKYEEDYFTLIIETHSDNNVFFQNKKKTSFIFISLY